MSKEKFLEGHEIEKALSDAYERGVKTEIVMHENTNPTLRKLGTEGKIILFYTPLPVSKAFVDDKKMFYATKDRNKFNLGEEEFFIKEGDFIMGNDRYEAETLTKEIDKLEKYPIPATEVDNVFNMIDSKKDPNEIVKYLKEKPYV